MGIFSRKKSSSNNNYSITSDPSMTKWENQFCDSCGRSTQHKISKISQNSDRAVIKCTKCQKWDEGYW